MKKTVGGILVVGALAFSAIGGWYLAKTSAAESEEKAYTDWANKAKLVPVKFVIKAPAETPADQPLFLSGSAPALGQWEAAGVPLAKQPDGTYAASVEVTNGVEYGYKVTRSTWGTVECAPSNEDIPNRTFVAQDDKGVVEATVAAWRDKGKSVPGRITLTGMIRQHRKVHNDLLPLDRDIYVYLPPGYDDEGNDKRYPVLYMQDGQNLFNEATSFNGIEWKVDETAEKLIKDNKIEPVIIVGVFNTEYRTAEFTTPALAGPDKSVFKPGDKPLGDVYAKMFVEQIKPMIDEQYRTQPDAAHTAIAGSSMGALIDLEILKAYPQAFTKVALLTPHLRNKAKDIYSAIGDDLSFLKGKKIWIDMGDKGGDNYPGADPMADAKAFVAKLESAGLKRDADFKYVELPGTEHNEPAWQGRVDQVLMYLYGK